jgi:hypothetical protein
MLTSYMMKCPYLGCNWSGSLLPEGSWDSWKHGTATVYATKQVVFHCPKCGGEWHGRIHGDDIEIEVPDRTPAPWALQS